MFWFVLYIASIVLANALLKIVGTVPVAPGLMAPAGVYAIGLCYICRNQTQEALGRRWSVAAIPIGAALSMILSPEFALASGVSVLLAESLDYLIYTPLRKRGRIRAMVLSCLAGDVADSVLFLVLAFHSLAFLEGQLVGKWETVGLAILVMAWSRRGVSGNREHAGRATDYGNPS